MVGYLITIVMILVSEGYNIYVEFPKLNENLRSVR